jgi:hypothetical protein
MAPNQDRPITLKTRISHTLCCNLLDALAMRGEGRHGIIVVSAKVIPKRLISRQIVGDNPFLSCG